MAITTNQALEQYPVLLKVAEAAEAFFKHTATSPYERGIDLTWDEHYDIYYTNLNNELQNWREVRDG